MDVTLTRLDCLSGREVADAGRCRAASCVDGERAEIDWDGEPPGWPPAEFSIWPSATTCWSTPPGPGRISADEAEQILALYASLEGPT